MVCASNRIHCTHGGKTQPLTAVIKITERVLSLFFFAITSATVKTSENNRSVFKRTGVLNAVTSVNEELLCATGDEILHVSVGCGGKPLASYTNHIQT